MGIFRKITSITTGGMVDLKSDKERIASNTKKIAKESEKQTKIMKREEFKQRVLEQQAQQRRLGQESSVPTVSTPEVDVNSSRLTQLKALGDLRDSGVLTAEEFELEKARILSSQ